MASQHGNESGIRSDFGPLSQAVCGAKHLRIAANLLGPLRGHKDCHNRKLQYGDYVKQLMLYFLNPILTSMRGLQQCSELDITHSKFGLPRFSLGSFSEAGRVFDPELLVPIISNLAQQVPGHRKSPLLDQLSRPATAVDGTLLDALPGMTWALWISDERRAAKVHLQLDLLTGAPCAATLTHGNGNERSELQRNLRPGHTYVMDAGYGGFELLLAILDIGSSFIVRVKKNTNYKVLEELPISDADRRAGVEKDCIIELGCSSSPQLHGRRLRLVQIYVPDTTGGKPRTGRLTRRHGQRHESNDHTLLLVTDILDVPVLVIGDVFRHRWDIELFFRWFKKVLGTEHLLSQSPNGLAIMICAALIVYLLLLLWAGGKPTRRQFELIAMYMMGMADTEEIMPLLAKTAGRSEKNRG